MPDLTVAGTEITDAVRTTGTSGDGRTPPDSSFGVWEATTNLLPNGGFETNTSGWIVQGTGSVARDTTYAKFGAASLKTIITAAAGPTKTDGASFSSQTAVGSFVQNDYAAASVWVYCETETILCLQLFPRTAAGAGVTPTIESANTTVPAGVWTKISVAGQFTHVDTSRANIKVVLVTAGSTGTWWVDGAQIEKQPLATPYVETNGGTATRAAARVQAPASLLDETQGWFAMRVRMGWGQSNEPLGGASFPFLFSWLDSATERLVMFYSETSNTFGFDRDSGGGSSAVTSGAQTFSAGDLKTIICAWTATQTKISIDGGAFTSAATATIPAITATTFDIGTGGVSNHADLDVHWFACGAGTLADADAATLHAFGNGDPRIQQLPGRPTMVWAANTVYYDRALITSGNEITDASRADMAADSDSGESSDGVAVPDSSIGIWEETTNLITNGGLETNATGWVAYLGATVTRSTEYAKFGTASLKVVTPGAAGGEGVTASVRFAVTPAQIVAGSAWMYSPSATGTILLYEEEFDSGGSYLRSQLLASRALSAVWTRWSGAVTVGASAATAHIVPRVTGTQAITFYCDGFQAEVQPIATPYVETNGGTASRSAARVQAPASLLDETQGWVAMRVRMGWPSTSLPNAAPVAFEWRNGTAPANQLSVFRASTTNWEIDGRRNGTLTTRVVAAAHAAGDYVTLIGRWTDTTIALSVNGGAFNSTARGGTVGGSALPATFEIGNRDTLGLELDSDVFWFACGTGTLTDADAATIHAFGNGDPPLSALPGTPTAVFPMNNSSYTETGETGFAANRMLVGIG